MATFIQATSDAAGEPKVYINADTIAWIEPNDDGSRIVFNSIAATASDAAFGSPHVRSHEHDLTVKESPEELLKAPRL